MKTLTKLATNITLGRGWIILILRSHGQMSRPLWPSLKLAFLGLLTVHCLADVNQTYLPLPNADIGSHVHSLQEPFIFAIKVVLPVQCGGRKKSPHTPNQCCYIFILVLEVAVRGTLSHALWSP